MESICPILPEIPTGRRTRCDRTIGAGCDIIVIEMAEACLFAIICGALAGVVLAVHLVWILWVIFGALLTRHRPLLGGLHIVSLIYGIVIELAPWPCPLTLAEQWVQGMRGTAPYSESFLVHYLGRLVYPEVPQTVLVWGAVAVAAFNLGIYGRRFWRWRRPVGLNA
jgi:hypothetical protein